MSKDDVLCATNAITCSCVLYILCVLIVASCRRRLAAHKRTITIVVLGDLGRSPRMLYHAQSLLENGYHVNLIGYGPTRLSPALSNNKECNIVHVKQFLVNSGALPRFAFVAIAPLKVLLTATSLLLLLLSHPTSYILVQNPPSFPTLPVAQLVSWLYQSRLVIDWHNTGTSILALRLGDQHPMVRLSSILEALFGKRAFAHFYVSRRMQTTLSSTWHHSGVQRVLYDRSPTVFSKLSMSERENLFQRVPALRPPQDALMVFTSTSWTADEDFDLFFDALRLYETSLETQRHLFVVITGKGPLRERFERMVGAQAWQKVSVRFAWLEVEDYPKLIGAADVGISLHSSSSGMDLPMKVVDMFGAELPVLALDFPALSELVQHGVNGLVFTTRQELFDSLVLVASDAVKLEQLRRGVKAATFDAQNESKELQGWTDWDSNWRRVVLPLLQ